MPISTGRAGHLTWALCILTLLASEGMAQAPPEFEALDAAYRDLAARNYDGAIAGFRRAAAIAPQRVDIRKDLAYTLLKIGENEAARDQFDAAMQADPNDQTVALEFAFLANETRQPREARRVFDRLRRQGNATAEEAFGNIDRPLAEGIARWTAVVASDPANFSAHFELATLTEQRDERELAARHYEAAWRLRPDRRDLLVSLGRMRREMGFDEDALAALLAASRGAEARAAEEARKLLPERYPYVYEFRRALELDPDNQNLRRELGFLLIQMGDTAAGEKELEGLVDHSAPTLQDRADQNLAPNLPAREMGFKSFEAGYFLDAARYFSAALEQDPLDFSSMLQLGWTHNLLHQDREAVRWFDLAGRSPDPIVAEEARRALRNLAPGLRRVQTTVWALPLYSTRWRSGFGYGQVKVEFRLGPLPVRPYLSARFIGDTRGNVRAGSFGLPQYLSETSVVPGVGLITPSWRGLLVWAEAGLAVSYLDRGGQRRTLPDYRGGVSFSRSVGSLIGAEAPGLFFEHHLDGVYVHRFNRTFLGNTQNRAGLTVPAGPLHWQLTWNWNANADPKRQYWANFVETGPGIRLHIDGMPASMLFTADALHGRYTVQEGNPRARLYNDLRLGIWYAFTR